MQRVRSGSKESNGRALESTTRNGEQTFTITRVDSASKDSYDIIFQHATIKKEHGRPLRRNAASRGRAKVKKQRIVKLLARTAEEYYTENKTS